MITVVIRDKNPNEIMDIVKELRNKGLVQGQDFDFAYTPSTEDWMNGVRTSKYTTFTFYSEKHATLFALKYSS